jgi:uncharacterized protein (TIGR00369 family)
MGHGDPFLLALPGPPARVKERAVSLGCPLLDALGHRHEAGDDEYAVELAVDERILGPGGSVHGGLVASLVDCAGAGALARATERPVATSNVALSYLAAGRRGPLRAVAETLSLSRRQGVASVKVFDVGQDHRLVASALLTVAFLDGPAFEGSGPSAP